VSHIVAGVPIHLNPATELAERVLLPGDPHRALTVATALLDGPKMFNHRRGLWGYTGTARDGEPLTIQATGMGGPSAAIVCEELIELGARTLIRIGTCGALNADLALGEIVAVREALARDGTSRELGAGDAVLPDPDLTAAIDARAVTAASVDLFYGEPDTSGADVVEMECATLFQVAKLRGARAAAVLGVSDLLTTGRAQRIDQGELELLGTHLGEAAYLALAASS
jgi:uridine phosphorylase